MSDSLQPQIAETIGRTMILRTSPTEIADAVMAIVQPELDRWRRDCDELMTAKREVVLQGAGALNRAEQAETERDATRYRLQQAEAAIERARAVWDEHRRSNPLVRPCTCLACRMYAALDQPVMEADVNRDHAPHVSQNGSSDRCTLKIPVMRIGALRRRAVRRALRRARNLGAEIDAAETWGLLESKFTLRAVGTRDELAPLYALLRSAGQNTPEEDG